MRVKKRTRKTSPRKKPITSRTTLKQKRSKRRNPSMILTLGTVKLILQTFLCSAFVILFRGRPTTTQSTRDLTTPIETAMPRNPQRSLVLPIFSFRLLCDRTFTNGIRMLLKPSSCRCLGKPGGTWTMNNKLPSSSLRVKNLNGTKRRRRFLPRLRNQTRYGSPCDGASRCSTTLQRTASLTFSSSRSILRIFRTTRILLINQWT
mmetsp:Transcript_37307/g.55597  ORF Transcript_37307/g.55597 Transcript_37307/m.55597 type:complete len:205 (+) Transcript_37307:602-1216(+)